MTGVPRCAIIGNGGGGCVRFARAGALLGLLGVFGLSAPAGAWETAALHGPIDLQSVRKATQGWRYSCARPDRRLQKKLEGCLKALGEQALLRGLKRLERVSPDTAREILSKLEQTPLQLRRHPTISCKTSITGSDAEVYKAAGVGLKIMKIGKPFRPIADAVEDPQWLSQVDGPTLNDFEQKFFHESLHIANLETLPGDQHERVHSIPHGVEKDRVYACAISAFPGRGNSFKTDGVQRVMSRMACETCTRQASPCELPNYAELPEPRNWMQFEHSAFQNQREDEFYLKKLPAECLPDAQGAQVSQGSCERPPVSAPMDEGLIRSLMHQTEPAAGGP